MHTRSALLLVLVSAALVSSACDNLSSAAARDETGAVGPTSVETLTISESPLARSVTVNGTLAAEEQVMLSFKVTGRLEELNVDLGSHVTRGQVLARLSPTDFELRLQQATAALQQARVRLGLPADGTDDTVVIENTALVRQQRALLDEAALKRERIATFVTRGISAQADLDTADAQHKVAEGRYQDAIEEMRNRQAILAQRRSELALSRQQLEDSILRSPIDGIVRERHVFAGEYRTAGTPVVTVVQQHPLRLQLSVPERVSSDVRVGQTVRVHVEGDEATYEGRVVRLSPAITEGNRTLPIEAEVPNPDGRLRPGTFARAEIVTREQPGIVVPQSAVVAFAGIEKILTVVDGKATETRIRSGRRFDATVEVLDGLAPGDVVILEPGSLTNGATVTPVR